MTREEAQNLHNGDHVITTGGILGVIRDVLILNYAVIVKIQSIGHRYYGALFTYPHTDITYVKH